MTKYLLAAVQHDHTQTPTSDGYELEIHELMAPMSKEAFREQVTPHITNRSLLILESKAERGLIRPGHPSYERLHSYCGGAIGDLTPSFAVCDPRPYKELLSKLIDWDLFCSCTLGIVRDEFLPLMNNLNEVVERIRSGGHPSLHVLRPFEREKYIVLGKELRQWDILCNKVHLKTMREYGPRHDTCVVVTGSAHSLSMALKTGYTITDLAGHIPTDHDFLNEPTLMYFFYLCLYVWLDQL